MAVQQYYIKKLNRKLTISTALHKSWRQSDKFNYTNKSRPTVI